MTDEERLELGHELGELGKCVIRKKEALSALSVTQEQYVAHELPVPEKKSLIPTSKPSPKSLLVTAAISLILLVACLALLINIISGAVKAKRINSVAEEPGEEFEAWVALWDEVKTFDELEEGWAPVEKAWKKRSVDFSWEDVKELAKGKSTLYADMFAEDILDQVEMQAVKYNDTYLSLKGMGLFFAAIPLIVFLIMTKSRYGDWKVGCEKHEKCLIENDKRMRFNEEEYPKLVEERNGRIPEVEKEYQELVASVRADLNDAEEGIAARSHLLPFYYHDNAIDIALILLRGRADSVKEAINIFEQDQHAAEMQAMERERMDNEARHQMEMERQAAAQARAAQQAADQARQAAQAQEKMMRDQAQKQKDEAYRRCRACAHGGSCRAYGQINCSGFRPKS